MTVPFVAIGPSASTPGDALESTSQALLTLLQAMPTTIDAALENYRSNGVASTDDMAVAMADAEQAVDLLDAALLAIDELPTASEVGDVIDNNPTIANITAKVDAIEPMIEKIEATTAGTTTGAGTGTEVFTGSNATVTVTLDNDNNRTAVVVS